MLRIPCRVVNVRSGMQVSRRRCVRCTGSGMKDLGVKDGSSSSSRRNVRMQISTVSGLQVQQAVLKKS